MIKLPVMSSNKLLYLSIFSFVFVSSFALSVTKVSQFYKPQVITISDSHQSVEFPPVPILVNSMNSPTFSAESVLAIDVDSGVSLYEKNPEIKLLPASTTKMITALTALDYYGLDDVVKIENIKVEGQKMGLKEGEEISIRDLISGLLIYSANDAAEALASNFCNPRSLTKISSCGREYFIQAMNDKANDLHLDNTYFTNPTGLEGLGHLTTARDLTRIAIEGMKNPFFRNIVGTKQTTVISLDGKTKHKLVNLNELLEEVNGVLGVKTGWTENAKENLVTYVERDGRRIVITVLRSDDRFADTKELINWIFENYRWKSVRI